jgi:hypothetical protein
MNAELSPARRWAFTGHVVLFVAAAILAGLAVGGTWTAAGAVAGLCWMASGVLALWGRRALMRPGGLRGVDPDKLPDRERQGVEHAASFFVGMILILWGAVVLWLGVRWLRAVSGG